MRAPTLQRHRSLRYLVPAGVLVVALATVGVLKARGASDAVLPHTSPTSLITAVKSAHTQGFSGTIVSDVDLGLPELPDLGDGSGGPSLGSLLTGAHTMQIWYGGPDEQRIAMFGATTENDVFHDGGELWTWDSFDRTAVHTLLPSTSELSGQPALTLLTPAQLASVLLRSIDSSAKVRVGRSATVADRSAYLLTIEPDTTKTTIGEIRIAVDGETKVPLAVQIYPRGSSRPAIDVTFTSIRFGSPSDRNYEFTPPPYAKVRTISPESLRTSTADRIGAVHLIGSGWSGVLEARPSATDLRRLRRAIDSAQLPAVSGAWGRGRLLRTSLVDVLITDEGRVLAGAVQPQTLYAAAGT